MDPRAPVVVGVGQTSQREPAETAKPPIELLEDAARAAEADAGAALLASTDIVAVVQIVSWRYPDPGALLARRLGIAPRRTAVTTVGGNSPQLLVNEFADHIQRGDCDVVLIGGAESMYTRWRARREPRVELHWETGDDEPCSWVIGDDRPGTSDEEMRHGAVAPTHGVSRSSRPRCAPKRDAASTRTSSTSPSSGRRSPRSPPTTRTRGREPRTPPPTSAPCPPTTAWWCSRTPSGCARTSTSTRAPRSCCVRTRPRAPRASPTIAWCILHAGAEAHDHWFVTERDSLTRSPAIGATVGDVLDASTVGVDDIAHFDLYSCFPSAVQIAIARDRAHRLGAPAHRHRRPRLRGRTGEQLPDSRHRPNGRGAARRSRQLRLDDRVGLVPDEARGRGLVDPTTGRRLPARRSARDAAARSTRCRAGLRPGRSKAM